MRGDLDAKETDIRRRLQPASNDESSALDGTWMSVVVKVTFNNQDTHCKSAWALEQLLTRFDVIPTFELWLKSDAGPMISMLRNGESAFLMYLRFVGDSGFTSRRKIHAGGTAIFTLANGEQDEYPLSWCIDIGDCYRELIHFFSHDGAKSECVDWNED